MVTKSGCNIVRLAELQWEVRVRHEGKHHRAKTYWHDAENNLTMQFVDQPANSIEPLPRQPGTHATTVLKGRALINDQTLNTLDVILDSGNEPHGSAAYPDACQLFSCFQSSSDPASAQALSGEKHHRLIQSETIPWDAKAGGALHMKTLVDRGAGRLMLTAMRLSAGFTVPIGSRPHMQAALVVDGSALIDDETLNPWDFIFMAAGVPHGPISFPLGATLLMVAMRPA